MQSDITKNPPREYVLHSVGFSYVFLALISVFLLIPVMASTCRYVLPETKVLIAKCNSGCEISRNRHLP